MATKPRPRIQIPLSRLDSLAEWAGWMLLVILWMITIWAYDTLPETIPTHFNAVGEADDFGRKSVLWILPAISTMLFTGMTILNRYPHMFNYPVTITTENALRQYILATRMIRYLKLIMLVIFLLILMGIISRANDTTKGLGAGFLPFSIGLILLTVGYYTFQSMLKKKQTS